MKVANSYDHIKDQEEEECQTKIVKQSEIIHEELEIAVPDPINHVSGKYMPKLNGKFASPQVLGFMLFAMILIIIFVGMVDTSHQEDLIKEHHLIIQNYKQQAKKNAVKPIESPIIKKYKKEAPQTDVEVQKALSQIKQKKVPAGKKSEEKKEIVKNKVAAIFISEGRYDTLEKTLKSFQEMNTFPLEKTIVVTSENKSEKVTNLIKKFPTLEWKVIEAKIGELATMDQVLSGLEKSIQYFFYSKDNFQYIKKGFIQQAILKFENEANTSQVLLKNFDGVNYNITLMDDLLAGFTLRPSLNSLEAYYSTGLFTNATKNVTYGKSAEQADIIISLHYLDHGYHISALKEDYIKELPPSSNSIWSKFTVNQTTLKKQPTFYSNIEKDQMWFINKTKDAAAVQYNLVKLAKKQANGGYYLQVMLSPPPVYGGVSLVDLGADKNIQVGSKLDYLNIESTIKFGEFRVKLQKTYMPRPYFGPKGNKQNKQQVLKVENLAKLEQVETFLKAKASDQKQNFHFNLAKSLVENTSNQKLSLQAQYTVYNKTHNIQKALKKLNLCIFTQGFNILTKSNWKNLFKSIQNQNYSNYKFVLIDDASKDSTRNKIFDEIKKSYPKLFNRLEVASLNEQRIYAPGSMHIRVKKYCGFSDVVVNVSPNSQFVGKQAFNVINSAFQNENIWFVAFPAVEKDNDGKLTSNKLQPIKDIENFRTSDIKFEPYLKAYRYKLNFNLPIESSIYFERNNGNGYLIPKFYPTNSDVFQTYSYIEMSGSERVKFADEFLSIYKEFPLNGPCVSSSKNYWGVRAQTKTPFKKLESISAVISKVQNYQIPNKILADLKQKYTAYQECLKKQNPSALVDPKFWPQVPPFQTIQYGTIGHFVTKDIANKAKAYNIPAVNSFVPIQQLPFCLLMNIEGNSEQKLRNDIIESIFGLSYSNYIAVFLTSEENKESLNKTISQMNRPQDSIYKIISAPSKKYESIRLITNSLCVQNSLIMFVNYILAKQSLIGLNKIHQTTRSWLTFSETPEHGHVHSFYSRVYDFLDINEAEPTLQKYIDDGNQNIQTIGLFELCLRHRTPVQFSSVYLKPQSITENPQPIKLYSNMLVANKSDGTLYSHKNYTYLLSFNEYPGTNLKQMQKQMYDINKGIGFEGKKQSQINFQEMVKALQYQQAWYLPIEHNIHKKQRYELGKAYDINSNIYSPDDQLPMCFTMAFDQNMAESKILRSIKSVLRQNYTNFHMVMIDDSQGQLDKWNTLDKIRTLIQQSKVTIPIKYIKNSNKKYSTYNILNAAFNYCKTDDIQIYIDGGYQLIGVQFLTTFNWIYINNRDNWFAYTNYKNAKYKIGDISRFVNENEYIDFNGRKKVQSMPPVNSWTVQLIRSIPLKYHVNQNGDWFKTATIEALSRSMIELSTTIHSDYIPYIAYQKYQLTPQNQSNYEALTKLRSQELKYILQLPPLETMHPISENYINERVSKILQNDEGKEYTALDVGIKKDNTQNKGEL